MERIERGDYGENVRHNQWDLIEFEPDPVKL